LTGLPFCFFNCSLTAASSFFNSVNSICWLVIALCALESEKVSSITPANTLLSGLGSPRFGLPSENSVIMTKNTTTTMLATDTNFLYCRYRSLRLILNLAMPDSFFNSHHRNGFVWVYHSVFH